MSNGRKRIEKRLSDHRKQTKNKKMKFKKGKRESPTFKFQY